MKKLKFSSSSKLRTPAEFKAVFFKPLRSSSPQMTVLARRNDKEVARLGIIVAKRTLPRAVDRNRIRRLIRECFRLSQQELKGLDIIVLPKSGSIQFHGYDAICQHLKQRWKEVLDQCKK